MGKLGEEIGACHPVFCGASVLLKNFIGMQENTGIGWLGSRRPNAQASSLEDPKVKKCWVPAKGLSLQKKKEKMFGKVYTPTCQECHNPMLLVNSK